MPVVVPTEIRPHLRTPKSHHAQRGSGILEVSFCIGLVSIVCFAATTGLGEKISLAFTNIVIQTGGGIEGIPLPDTEDNGYSDDNNNNSGGAEGEGW